MGGVIENFNSYTFVECESEAVLSQLNLELLSTNKETGCRNVNLSVKIRFRSLISKWINFIFILCDVRGEINGIKSRVWAF